MSEKRSYLMSVFGTPSALTRWIINVSVAIAREVSADHTFIAAASLDDLRNSWAAKKSGSIIFHSDSPREELRRIFLKNNYPLVLVSEPLWRVACYCITTRQLDPILAARITTQSACTLSTLQDCAFIFRVSEANYPDRAVDLIEQLLNFYGIEASVSSLPGLLAEMRLADRPDMTVEESLSLLFPDYNHDAQYPRSSLADDARFVLSQYEPLLRDLAPVEFIWPPTVCFKFEPEIAYLDGSVEMVGAARILIGGHSLCLPQGRWRARVFVEISDNLSGNRLRSDVFAEDQVFATVTAVLPKSGLFYYDIDFECQDPFYPIIIQLAITEGAIEGWLTLREISIVNVDLYPRKSGRPVQAA